MRTKLILFVLLPLMGCKSNTQIPEVIEPITKDRLVFIPPPMPIGLSLEVPTFHVVTDTTCNKVIGENGPLFSMDALGYQQMARNIQELRRYILELQNVVKYYEEVISEINNDNETNR